MKVKEFMTRGIITVEQTLPVIEAARLMAAEDIGSLLVTHKEELVGIVTRKDIIAAQLLSQESYNSLAVGDIMTTPVVSVSPDTDLWQIISLMDATGKMHIPVVSGDETIGLVSSSDVIRVLATIRIIQEAQDDL